MEETAAEETKGKQEYKKLKKLLKKAIKSSIEATVLYEDLEQIKDTFPGYREKETAYEEAPYGEDTFLKSQFQRLYSSFAEENCEEIDRLKKAELRAQKMQMKVVSTLFSLLKQQDESEGK